MNVQERVTFEITGGGVLEGSVDLQGSKNAAGPIIAATLLTPHPCVLSNIPRVRDAFVLLEIMQKMGSRQRWLDEHTLEITNDEIDPAKIDNDMVSRIRLSILLVGPLVARFGEATIASPGGCYLGARSIETHLEAFRDSGVEVQYDEEHQLYHLKKTGQGAAEIILGEFSVTATENMMMFHALTAHPVAIRLAAAEPHVQDLGVFLQKLGVAINGLGTHDLSIRGWDKIERGAAHEIVPDYLEAGTFLVAGVLTGGAIAIPNARPDHLAAVLKKLKEFGANIEERGRMLVTVPSKRPFTAATVKTFPYPGFPTDLQALFGLLATQAEGKSVIFDTLFENRLKYIDELKKMGAEAVIENDHRAVISGPTPLRGIAIQSLDIRAGATMVIAGLIAEGVSVIASAEQIERGYEKFDEKLARLGARITRKPLVSVTAPAPQAS